MPFVIYRERKPQESAKQYAYEILRRNIMRLDMVPGEIIQEKEIARQLQVSRTPVREALLELSRQFLVDISPQRHTRVALMDEEMIEQGRFLRCTIETALLDRLCGELDPSFLQNIEEVMQYQEQMCKEKNLLGFFEADNAFHKALFQAAKLDTVYEVLSTYVPHFSRERMLRLQMFNCLELMRDHKTVVEAIRIQDAQAAKVAMKNHLNRVVCDQKILKEAYPSYYK